MIYCFDLDGTICTNTEGDYENSSPFLDRIKIINKLYNDGHIIKIETARGSGSGIDWREVTENQLKEWDVKYHVLRVGIKMHADIFIDDKAILDKDFFKQ